MQLGLTQGVRSCIIFTLKVLLKLIQRNMSAILRAADHVSDCFGKCRLVYMSVVRDVSPDFKRPKSDPSVPKCEMRSFQRDTFFGKTVPASTLAGGRLEPSGSGPRCAGRVTQCSALSSRAGLGVVTERDLNSIRNSRISSSLTFLFLSLTRSCPRTHKEQQSSTYYVASWLPGQVMQGTQAAMDWICLMNSSPILALSYNSDI